jgi:hypothetical protein
VNLSTRFEVKSVVAIPPLLRIGESLSLSNTKTKMKHIKLNLFSFSYTREEIYCHRLPVKVEHTKKYRDVFHLVGNA